MTYNIINIKDKVYYNTQYSYDSTHMRYSDDSTIVDKPKALVYTDTILDIQAIAEKIDKNYQKKVRLFFANEDLSSQYFAFLDVLKKYNEIEFNKIIACGTYTIDLVCRNGHGFKLPNKCNSKYCPFCNRSKTLKYRALLKDFLRGSSDVPLRFLTLTWVNTFSLTATLKRKYRKDFTKFKVLLKKYGYIIEKGIKTEEIKYNENTGFNNHLHLLFYARYKPNKEYIHLKPYFKGDGWIDVKWLRKEWKKITGDSHILKFERIKKGVKGGVNYLTKYITKSENIYNININKLKEYDLYLLHHRLIDKFGFKDKLSDYKAVYLCPICGEKLRYPDEGQSIENFYDTKFNIICKADYQNLGIT